MQFVEGKELDISEAIINLCRIGLKQESQKNRTTAYLKGCQEAGILKEQVSDTVSGNDGGTQNRRMTKKKRVRSSITICPEQASCSNNKFEVGHFQVFTEQDAYRQVTSRGHNITLQSFRQNYSRYGFSRKGDIYIFGRTRILKTKLKDTKS
jgi:hypothetical protein